MMSCPQMYTFWYLIRHRRLDANEFSESATNLYYGCGAMIIENYYYCHHYHHHWAAASCLVVGRSPRHHVSKLAYLVLSSARSCRSSICPGRLSIVWLVSVVVFSYRMVSKWWHARSIGRLWCSWCALPWTTSFFSHWSYLLILFTGAQAAGRTVRDWGQGQVYSPR